MKYYANLDSLSETKNKVYKKTIAHSRVTQ